MDTAMDSANGVPSSKKRNLLVPPINFAMVYPGVYRSGFPNGRNFRFLETVLKLKSIIHLSDEDDTGFKRTGRIGELNANFIRDANIQEYTFAVRAHKEPFGYTDDAVIASVLSVLLDVRTHPVLLHDDKGKHRAGVVIGCLRKIQGWSLASIFLEYSQFTQGSVRLLDLQCMEFFTHPIQCSRAHLPKWLTRPELVSAGQVEGYTGTVDGRVLPKPQLPPPTPERGAEEEEEEHRLNRTQQWSEPPSRLISRYTDGGEDLSETTMMVTNSPSM